MTALLVYYFLYSLGSIVLGLITYHFIDIGLDFIKAVFKSIC